MGSFLVSAGLRCYPLRRISALKAELESACTLMSAETHVQRTKILSQLVRTIVGVIERHYPGAAAAEIESATGVSVSTSDLLDGSCEEVAAAFAARHLASDR